MKPRLNILNRISLGSAVILGLFSCKKEDKPNIIIFLIDDAGYADFGFMGSKDLQTPNIDNLAGEGVVFTDAHTSATVCGPSRAGLITGKYQQRFGFECNDIPRGEGLDTNEVLLPELLKEQGYATLAIGKWHLGETEPYLPNNRGFDEFYGFLGGARSYFPYADSLRVPAGNRMMENDHAIHFEGYLTDRFGDKTVEFIDKNKDRPFFIYFSPNAVHAPMEAKEEHIEKFKNADRPVLSAMMWSLDENVGKVVEKLKEEGLYDNTLIFFLSDNGGALSNNASCEPLKGWKGNKFEGGHRVPFFVSWPSNIPGGRTFSGLTSALDIFATSLDAVKANLPQIDGMSLLPWLMNEKGGNPHETLFWRKDKMAAVRDGNLKLIRLDGYGTTLYNLNQDLTEEEDLTSADSITTVRLTKDLDSWEQHMEKPRWLEAEKWNIVNFEIHQALMQNREPRYKNPKQYLEYEEEFE